MTRKHPIGSPEAPLVLIPFDETAEELHPEADLLKLIRDGSIPEIQAQFPSLQAELLEYEPIHLLGVTAFYTLIWAVGASAERKARYQLEPADIEALQGLLLTQNRTKDLPLAKGDLGEIWARFRNSYFACISSPPLDFLTPEKALLADNIRLHCAYYRNPYGRSFLQRMMSFITEEFEARQHQGDRNLSFFFDFVMRLLEVIDGRMSEVRAKLIQANEGNAEDVRGLINQLVVSNANAAEVYQGAPTDLPLASLRTLFHHVLDASASDIFMFTPEQLRQISPNPSYDPVPDVDRCSLRFGETKDLIFEKIARSNPVWGKPFVRVDNNYFLFLFFTVMSFPFSLFLSVVRGEPKGQKERLEKVRAKFLELECESLLRKHIPGAEVFRNLFWSDASGKTFETDVLAIIEDRLLVFEAKGSILPDRVRIGNFEKSKSFLKDTYGAAGVQASRLEEEIRTSTANTDLFGHSGQKLLTLNSATVKKVVAYSITLDQLGTFSNGRHLFEEIGIIDPGTFPVPPLMASELAKVMELLPDEVHRLHYLDRRHDLYSAVHVVADELDIFATYVMHGFGTLPTGKVQLVTLLNASFYLDRYVKNGTVVFPETSTVSNTKYFDRVLAYVLQRRPKDFLELAFALIDTPPEAQHVFEQMMKELRPKVRNRDEQVQVFSLKVDRSFEPFVLAGSMYGEIPREERNDVLTKGLADAIAKRGLKKGVLIGRQLGFSEYPYSVIMFLSMSKEQRDSYLKLAAQRAE
jgi:hypothetical protein